MVQVPRGLEKTSSRSRGRLPFYFGLVYTLRIVRGNEAFYNHIPAANKHPYTYLSHVAAIVRVKSIIIDPLRDKLMFVLLSNLRIANFDILQTMLAIRRYALL